MDCFRLMDLHSVVNYLVRERERHSIGFFATGRADSTHIVTYNVGEDYLSNGKRVYVLVVVVVVEQLKLSHYTIGSE